MPNALITMHHKVAEWGANRVVVVGTPMAPTETIWGLMANSSPGTGLASRAPRHPVARPCGRFWMLISRYSS